MDKKKKIIIIQRNNNLNVNHRIDIERMIFKKKKKKNRDTNGNWKKYNIKRGKASEGSQSSVFNILMCVFVNIIISPSLKFVDSNLRVAKGKYCNTERAQCEKSTMDMYTKKKRNQPNIFILLLLTYFLSSTVYLIPPIASTYYPFPLYDDNAQSVSTS